MAMDSDAALRLQNMQIDILGGEELLARQSGWLLPIGIDHPVFKFAGKLTAIAELEIVGEYVPVMEEAESAVWALADTNLLKH